MQKWLHESSKRIVCFLVLLLLWFVAAKLELWSTYLLPAPETVYATALTMLADGELVEAVGVSFRRVFLGFGMAFFFAFCVGVLGALLPQIRVYYTSFIDFIRHIPPLSLIPLLILWTGIGELPKIIVIFLEIGRAHV